MKKRFIKLLLLFFCLAGLYQNASANHLAGGELTYTWYKGNYYILKFAFYRNCSTTGGINRPPLPDTFTYCVFAAGTKALYARHHFSSKTHDQKVQPAAPHCQLPSGYCYEQAIYIDTIQLGSDTVGYHVVYTNGNRDAFITNLSSPKNAGFIWYCFIPPVKYHNSSPQFLTIPLPYQCVGVKSFFNQDVYDPDKDSLVFTNVTPWDPGTLAGGSIPIKRPASFPPPVYPTCSYNGGYSLAYPFNSVSSAPLGIDQITGTLSDSPASTGEYVVAIQISEYRYDPVQGKSILIGFVRRDYEFIVNSCASSTNKPPAFDADSQGYTRRIDPDSNVCFNVSGTDPDATDTAYIWATGGMFSGNANSNPPYATFPADTGWKGKYSGFTKPHAKSSFCWKPDCSKITYTSPYLVTFNLADNGCHVEQRVYKIYVNPRPIYKGPKLWCADILSSTSAKLTFKSITATKGNFLQYKIYRMADTESSYTAVDSISSYTTNTWTDTHLINAYGHAYSYFITSTNTCNVEGLASDTISTLNVSYNVLSDKRVDFTWNKQHPNTKVYYRIMVDRGAGFTKTDSTKATAYSIASCSENFKLKIQVLNDSGSCSSNSNSTPAISLKDITPPNIANKLINASYITGNYVNITFNASDSGDVKWYYIYRGLGTGYNKIDSVKYVKGVKQYSYTDKTASSVTSRKYYYEIRAKDSCGNLSALGNYQSPVMLAAKAGELSSKLTWRTYQGYNIDTVEIQRAINGSWLHLAWVPVTDSSYLDSGGLHCGAVVSYRIMVKESAGGNGQVSYSDSAADAPIDSIAPAMAIMEVVSVKNSTSINITWDKVADPDVKKYEVYLSKNGGSFSGMATYTASGPGPYTYTRTGLNTQQDTFSFQIKALDSCGNYSKTTQTHIAVVLKAGNGQLASNLRWSYYGGFTVKNYIVQKLSGGIWTSIATLSDTATTYSDTGLICKGVYNYRIKITQNGGISQTSYSDSAQTNPFDSVSPAKVFVISASVLNTTTTRLTFNKVPDKDVKDYQIYSAVNGGSYSLLTTIKTPFASPYTYTHTGLNTLNNTYSYKVIAVDTCKANTSKSFTVHTTVKLSGTSEDLSNLLTWTSYQGFTADSYTVQRWNGAGWADIYTGIKTTYLDTPLNCNVTRYYRIKTTETGVPGVVSYSDSIPVTPYDTVKPDKPLISYVTLKNDSTVYLVWNKVKANDVKQYIIYREGPSASSYTDIDTVTTDTFYTDKFAARLTGSWCYKVQAMDSCANNLSQPSLNHCTVFPQSIIYGCKQQVTVKWNPYINWIAGVSSYKVYRRTNGGAETLVGTVTAPTDTILDNSGITCRNVYTYRIEADEKSSAISSSSQTVDAIPAKPATPFIYSASKISTSGTTGQIVIKWSPQNTSATRYIKTHTLLSKKVGGGSFSVLSANMPVSQDSFVNTGLNTSGDDYEYYIYATDSCGNISDTSSIHKTMNLTMTIGRLIHKLSWTAYQGWPVKRYVIQWYISKKWINVDTVAGTATTYTRFPAPCYRIVYYRVVAQDSTANTALSDTAGGAAIDSQPPNKATIHNATVLSGSSAFLTFTGSDSLDVYEYVVERSNDAGTVFNTAGSMLFTSPAAALSFTDKVNTLNDYHRYIILTLDSCLNTAVSDTFATIQLRGQAENLQNRLFWQPFKGYTVDSYYVQIFSGGTWTNLAQLKGTDSFYVHTPLNCGVPRTYRLLAKEKGGSLYTTLSDSITLTPFDKIPPPPTTIDYVSVTTNSMIYIQWQKSVPKVKKYEIDFKTPNGAWTSLVMVNNKTNYFATGLNTVDSVYSFRIVAIDSCAGNRSNPSVAHSQVKLSVTAQNLAVKLDWTAYVGFSGVKYYYIYRFNGGWKKIDSVASGIISYTDSNLACNIRQHYRITAVDNTGAFFSNSDTTSAVPFNKLKPAPTTLNYVTILPNHNIKIAWKWNTATVDKFFEVWRKKDAGAFTKLATVTYDSSYTDNSTNPQLSKYWYYVIVSDSCSSLNRSDPSDTDRAIFMSSHTGGCKPYATIYWAPFQAFANGTSSYYIYKSSGSGFNYLTNISGSATSYTDSSVIENKYYCYRVVAVDSKSGFSSSSDSICVMPWIFPRPLGIKTKLVSVIRSSNTSGAVKIDWSKRVKGDTFTIAYRVYHAVNASGPYTMIHQENDTNTLSFIHSGINTLAANHFYYVVTLNSCNLESFPLDTFKTIDLRAANKNLEIDLAWNTFRGFPADTYEVYRSINGAPATLLANKLPADSVLTDLDVRCGLVYTYRVKAVQLAVNPLNSWSDSITATGKDTIPPRRADMLSASITSTGTKAGTILLTFNSANDINRMGYKIFRQDSTGGFSLIKTIKDTLSNNVVYTDINQNTYKTYHSYYIMTFDSCGNQSIGSDTHTVSLLGAVPVNGMNKVSWTSYTGFSNFTYKLERKTASTAWSTIVTLNPGVNFFADSQITCHVKYTYRITALESGTANFSYSNIDTATGIRNTPPAHPVLIRVTDSLTRLTNGMISMQWHPSATYGIATYLVYRSTDSINWKNIAAVNGTDTSYTDMLGTWENSYFYRIEARDSCGNTSADPMGSNTHHSIGFKTVAGNQETDISWNSYEGFPVAKYYLYRNGKVWHIFKNTDKSFIDTLVICGRMYRYVLEAVNADSSVRSFSNRDSVITIDHIAPRVVHMYTATVDSPNVSILVKWTMSTNYDARKYLLFRKYGDLGNQVLVHSDTNMVDTVYKDSLGNLGSRPYCYTVQVADYCDNYSKPSNEGCIMNLTGSVEPLINTLYWTPYRKWGKGIDRYNIYKKEDSAVWKLIGVVDSGVHSFKDENLDNFVKDHCYQVQAIEKAGYGATSKSTEMCLEQPPIVWMPNAFSPGSTPGINDVFGPMGTYYGSYQMNVFDRWGELIYSTSDGKPWNGKVMGSKVAPEGVYIYEITVPSYDGLKKLFFKGTVQIVK